MRTALETISAIYDSAQIDRMFRRLMEYIESSPDEGWRDVLGQIVVRAAGGNRPTWSQIGASPFWAYDFGVNDECWFYYHIPHDIVRGSDIHFHMHWMPDGTDANSVKWEFTYMYAKGLDQANFAVAGTVVTAEEAPPGTAYRHMVTETAAVTIAGLDEPDGIIGCNITRITNGATDNTDSIFGLTADIHYRSTSKATLGKAPDFYTK